jgi:hypothetical protein
MPDMKQTENVKAKGKIGVLKLKRETLRELDAGELKQAQGGARSNGPRCTLRPGPCHCGSRSED